MVDAERIDQNEMVTERRHESEVIIDTVKLSETHSLFDIPDVIPLTAPCCLNSRNFPWRHSSPPSHIGGQFKPRRNTIKIICTQIPRRLRSNYLTAMHGRSYAGAERRHSTC